jgi:DNA-binding TFAR19-related protein (PDSD5 family)
VLQIEGAEIEESVCGVIYSDIPLPLKIKIQDNVFVTYHGRDESGLENNIQVHLLAVNPPKNLDVFLIPDLSEALACLLSFSLRTRFAASRHWCHLDNDGRLSRPVDLFLKMASAFAGPLSIHAISPEGIQNRVKTLYDIVYILRKMKMKDFKSIARSLRLYQLALITYPIDVGLAYSLLVSSIDNLSRGKFVRFIEQFLPKTFWTEPDSRAWEEDRWLDSITPWERSIVDSYRERYEKDGERALSSLKGILNESAIERLKNIFSSKTELPSEEKKVFDHILNHWYLYRVDMKLTRDELPDILERIWEELRSAFFHGGRSPPESAIDRYETAPIKPKIKKNGTVVWRRDIPSFHTFERMAHDSILYYLRTEF